MSFRDRKELSHHSAFREALDDLGALSIPEDPANDLGQTNFESETGRLQQERLQGAALENQLSSTAGITSPLAKEVQGETLLDAIADGIDLSVKGLADRLKKLDDKLSKLLSGEEVGLPVRLQPVIKKKRKKKVNGIEVDIEEPEQEYRPSSQVSSIPDDRDR